MSAHQSLHKSNLNKQRDQNGTKFMVRHGVKLQNLIPMANRPLMKNLLSSDQLLSRNRGTANQPKLNGGLQD
jgi:hypothetical protein